MTHSITANKGFVKVSFSMAGAFNNGAGIAAYLTNENHVPNMYERLVNKEIINAYYFCKDGYIIVSDTIPDEDIKYLTCGIRGSVKLCEKSNEEQLSTSYTVGTKRIAVAKLDSELDKAIAIQLKANKNLPILVNQYLDKIGKQPDGSIYFYCVSLADLKVSAGRVASDAKMTKARTRNSGTRETFKSEAVNFEPGKYTRNKNDSLKIHYENNASKRTIIAHKTGDDISNHVYSPSINLALTPKQDTVINQESFLNMIPNDTVTPITTPPVVKEPAVEKNPLLDIVMYSVSEDIDSNNYIEVAINGIILNDLVSSLASDNLIELLVGDNLLAFKKNGKVLIEDDLVLDTKVINLDGNPSLLLADFVKKYAGKKLIMDKNLSIVNSLLIYKLYS